MPEIAESLLHRPFSHIKPNPYCDQPQDRLPKRKNVELDYSEYKNKGELYYKPSEHIDHGGVKIVEHKIIPASMLRLERSGRVLATGVGIGALLYSVSELAKSSFNIFSSALGMSSEDEAYETLGKAYNISSVAGALTGIAHESPYWAIGNIGMGIFGRKLSELWGLAGFLLSDGLASIGMGQVRYREGKNAFSVNQSIFNNNALSKFRFLMPVEQGIYQFFQRFTTLNGWRGFAKHEPYALFNTAGGGMVSAGALIGIASIFRRFMSESIQNFAYLPAGLFSLVNMIAFFRDGQKEVFKSTFAGKKEVEVYTQRAEGYLKQIASPFLVIRNLLFACKGIGLDTNGKFHLLGIGMQTIGAIFALLSFTFQSVAKFAKPETFGPLVKEKLKFFINPYQAARMLKSTMAEINSKKTAPSLEPGFNQILTSDPRYKSGITYLRNSEPFQRLFHKSQAGLPTYGREETHKRHDLDRGTHSERTCAIAMKIFDALKRNHTDIRILSFLNENEFAFKVSALLHDLMHGPFSHVLDKALPGCDNDENTVKEIENPYSKIHADILKASEIVGLDGKKVISQILHILRRKSPLYQLISGWGADRIEYERVGDFTTIDQNKARVEFDKWGMSEIESYVDTFRLFYDEDGTLTVGFTPEGALQAFLLCSDRQLFDIMYNSNPESFVRSDLIAALALGSGEYTTDQILSMSEPQVAELIFKTIEEHKPVEYTLNAKFYTGGRTGYSYYSSVKGDPTRIVVLNGKPREFLEYIKHVGDEKYINDICSSSPIFKKYPITVSEFRNRLKALTTLKETHVSVVFSPTMIDPEYSANFVHSNDLPFHQVA